MSTLVTNPFSYVHPVKQHHKNGCWAACLEWWARGVLGNSGIKQDKLRKERDIKEKYNSDSQTGKTFSTGNSKYGTLETAELMWLLQQSRWGMQVRQVINFNKIDLNARLSRGPVFIGFYDLSGNTWHVNIICNYDPVLDMVVAMEPRSGKFMDKGFADYIDNSDFNVIGWR